MKILASFVVLMAISNALAPSDVIFSVKTDQAPAPIGPYS